MNNFVTILCQPGAAIPGEAKQLIVFLALQGFTFTCNPDAEKQLASLGSALQVAETLTPSAIPCEIRVYKNPAFHFDLVETDDFNYFRNFWETNKQFPSQQVSLALQSRNGMLKALFQSRADLEIAMNPPTKEATAA